LGPGLAQHWATMARFDDLGAFGTSLDLLDDGWQLTAVRAIATQGVDLVDAAPDDWSFAMHPLARSVTGRMVWVQARIEASAAPVDWISGLRLWTRSRIGAPDGFWETLFSIHDGPVRVVATPYGRFGAAARDGDVWRVLTLALIDASQIVDVSVQILPATGRPGAVFDTSARGEVRVRTLEWGLLPIDDGMTLAIELRRIGQPPKPAQ
jgi:hypothetical protein